MHDYQRPPTLHRYGMRSDLELALSAGQFRLLPANGFLTLSFSAAWDKSLFEVLGPADSCLIIHNSEEFGERLHRAVQRTLPNWAGIDGPVEYGARSRSAWRLRAGRTRRAKRNGSSPGARCRRRRA
jgi:hypothetical protein